MKTQAIQLRSAGRTKSAVDAAQWALIGTSKGDSSTPSLVSRNCGSRLWSTAGSSLNEVHVHMNRVIDCQTTLPSNMELQLGTEMHEAAQNVHKPVKNSQR